MSINLSALETAPRALFSIPLRPMQGHRFQPTGFPGLGAATFQTSDGVSLLVESAQSMANRFEAVCWDESRQAPIPELDGISHVRITRDGKFFTDTMLEAHRLNSPYLLSGKKSQFKNKLKEERGCLTDGPIDRRLLANILFKYDVNSLIHGVFLAQSELAGGRLRVARALSSFIEADGVRIAASGGVKNDHVNPKGKAADGFGNVPFARDEYVADNITMYVNFDLALLRGYGLEPEAVRMLTLLGLFKVAKLVEGNLRLRTACDLTRAETTPITTDSPAGWELPSANELAVELQAAIAKVKDQMEATEFAYEAR